jgi:hypothetical protein
VLISPRVRGERSPRGECGGFAAIVSLQNYARRFEIAPALRVRRPRPLTPTLSPQAGRVSSAPRERYFFPPTAQR